VEIATTELLRWSRSWQGFFHIQRYNKTFCKKPFDCQAKSGQQARYRCSW